MGRRPLATYHESSRRLRIRLSDDLWRKLDWITQQTDVDPGQYIGDVVGAWYESLRRDEPAAVPQIFLRSQVTRDEVLRR